MKFCPNCGKQVKEDADFCPYCGHQFVPVKPKQKYCPNCGKPVKTDAEFCPNCGEPISDKAKQVQAQQAAIQAQNRVHQTSQPSIQSKQNPQTTPAPNRSRTDQKKHTDSKKAKKIGWGIGIAAIILAAGGATFFTIQNQKNAHPFAVQSSKSTQKTKKAKSHKKAKSDSDSVLKLKNKELSEKQQAAIVVAYAGKRYRKNEDWANALANLQSRKATLYTPDEYKFGSHKVEAPDNGNLYVVSPSVGYTVKDDEVTFVDKDGDGSPITFNKIISKLDGDFSKSDINDIASNVVFSSKVASQDSDSKSSDKLWSNSQEDDLSDYMKFFGDQMDQNSYEEYNGHTPLKVNSGVEYPNVFKDKTFKLNDETINIGWNPDVTKGNSKYGYNVVAIYNYDKGAAEFHITYLFCFDKDGNPVVLVDQTTNGDDIGVSKTENKYLNEAFNKIANHESPDMSTDFDK
ncbi:DUF4767 domain-containing protein [uncultured Lactobacillus sp.]|uniref:DUF4767 domain-containing protein n=1 Tax=uncultured Lactobacillus sp. TaxID=153152 RepID=UPI00260CB75E|nr:DUF4767 domain-containing protein [uncultured Lactobacillus sp.]